MKRHIQLHGILLITLIALFFSSCKKTDKDPHPEVKGNYFSIRQFALDEWNTFQGEPFTILHTIKINGKTDSSYTNSDTINWSNIFKTFFETDISDRKYLGQYSFNQFDDNADGTHNFFYEVIDQDEDLLTQKLLISIDRYNNKVKGIYIETKRKRIWDECTRKLYYSPLKTIQIQTNDKPLFGKATYTVEQFDFMR